MELQSDRPQNQVDGKELEEACSSSFTSEVQQTGIETWLENASVAFSKLRNICRGKRANNPNVVGVLLFEFKTCRVTKGDETKLDEFLPKRQRFIKIYWPMKV